MDSHRLGFVPTARAVDYREHRPWLFVQAIIAAAILGGIIGAAIALFSGGGSLASYRYDLWRWEARTIPSAVLHLVGLEPGHGELTDKEVLVRYFGLTTEIREASSQLVPDRDRLSNLRVERTRYDTRAEHIIRGYIDDAVRASGLQEQLPFFVDASLTWPPVEFQLTEPPHLLVRSPRDDIVRAGDRLLRGNLTMDDIDAIEAAADDQDTASIVVPIGGIAAYPAIIRADRNYWGVVETAAHEWVHHYLAFYPLGQQWRAGGDAYALNETVANIAGRALASIVHERNPISFPDGADGSIRTIPEPEPEFDFNSEMRQLRLRVDALLEQGHVEQAEELMEETRLELAEHGYVIRRLNQAYFAFYGTYADTPASSDPIGPKVEGVWQGTGQSPALFLGLMRDVQSVDDLDALVEQLPSTPER